MIDLDPRGVRRILIRQVNWLGDAVLSLPAVEALHRRFPQAEVVLLARGWVEGLFEGHPAVQRVMALPHGGGPSGLAARWRLARALRAQGFDLAVVLPNSFDAALTPWLAGIPRRVGFSADGRRWLLTDPVPRPRRRPGRHQAESYLDLARALGATGSADLQLPVSDRAHGRAAALLCTAGIAVGDALVAIGPGSIYGGAKRWPADGFARVADALVERRGARIVLVGSAREGAILAEVASRMRQPVVNLAGRTELPALAGVLARARLLLANDSGAMHLAAAVGTPVAAVFGPTDADATAPLGGGHRIVREPVPCSPCLFRECPIDHRCMRRLGVERVLREVLEVFDARAGAGRPATGWPAAFLDRDGTIIEDLGYLGDPGRIQFIPGAIEALQALRRAGFRLVVITNQAGVARGLITEADVQRVNERLRSLLAAGGVRLDAVYYCPHHVEHGPPEYRLDCGCRKPKPGMVERAVRELGLDPARSVVIGDHGSDTALARSFPGMRGVLLRTGHGAEQWEKVQAGALPAPDHVAADLAAAVQWVLSERGSDGGIAADSP
jgi:heptosyltransferase-2